MTILGPQNLVSALFCFHFLAGTDLRGKAQDGSILLVLPPGSDTRGFVDMRSNPRMVGQALKQTVIQLSKLMCRQLADTIIPMS